MFSRFRARLSVAALAVVAGACGSDSSTAPIETQPATLDQALTELALPAIAAAGPSFVDIGGTAALDPSRCPYAAASQSFVCTPINESGVTVNQSFTLLSASGAKQSAFDQASTAAVRANTTIAGTLVEAGTSLTIDGQQELTLSGLLTGPHTLNGSSLLKLKGTISNGTTSLPLDVAVSTTITNLVLPANTAAGAEIWPKSGTIVVESSGTVSGFPAGTTRLTMTFNGTSTVSLTITGPGVSQSCLVDLAKGEPVCG